jgi:hypothetical protein
MSPAVKSSLLAGVGGAIPGAIMSAIANYAFVGMPADATMNVINHAITGTISGFLGGFIGLFIYLRQRRTSS